ncbi:Oidioi.mRNA.OKI2018_I69.XSR.g14841.t1.cds [Oikopleura dioica]|uniref:Zinc finger CCCH domain-containing protein 15 n=1 Tax=Oikopleura dioica TaxID=34765 RepID=A0ABN7SF09_OIKDI|nr:Oidioi.mRNA.OKI2018_I69.XSR.g14841.t1.cds [Oikopleura dioica]
MESLPLPQPFQPDLPQYQESMIFLAVLPFIYLIFVMVVLMIFYCCVDFTTSREGNEKKSCCNWSASFYTISQVILLIASFFALSGVIMICFPSIENINKSAEKFIPEMKDTNLIPKTIASINSQLEAKSEEIDSISAKNDDFRSAVDALEAQLNKDTLMIENFLSTNALETTKTVTTITLWTSVGLFSLFALVAILSKTGVCLKSKNMLIGVTCVSFFAMVLCYLSLTVQLPVAVAVSDYCRNPKESKDSIVKMPDCESDEQLDTLNSALENLQTIHSGLSNHPNINTDTTLTELRNGVKLIIDFGESVKTMLNCEMVESEYAKITEAICTDSRTPFIVGWWAILASSFLVSLFIVTALLIAPCAWRNYDPHNDYGESGYDKGGDEFLPLNRPSHFQQPSYPPARQDGHLTLPSYLCHSSDDLILDRPPNKTPIMPPKKGGGASKKTEAKKKEKLIEDKTFGYPRQEGRCYDDDQKGKVDPKEKAKKADLHVDRRDEEKNKTMEGWTEEELRAAIEKKHGKSNKNAATTTDKICNHFLQAVEDNKYGWFWDCPNGDKCKYRHCLPEGYVLKKDLKKMKDAEKENQISLEDLIERERAALGPGTKITWETFSVWKKKKKEEKKKALEKENKKKKGKAKSGQTTGLTGRELFTFNANMGGDDDEAEDIEFEKEEDDPEEKVFEVGANTFELGASETLLRSKGAVPTSAENRYCWGGDSANKVVVVQEGTSETTTPAEKPAEPAPPAVEVDEDLFGEDLGDIDAELGDLGLEESAS